MHCETIRPLLDPFHDDELDATARAAVTAHLASCPGCTVVVAERQQLSAYLHRHGQATVPPGLAETIAHGGRPVTAGPAAAGLGGWLLPRLAAAGLGAVLVGAGWLASSRPSPPRPLPEPIASYLRPTDRINATPVGAIQDIRRLQRRPEQLVLEWARRGGHDK